MHKIYNIKRRTAKISTIPKNRKSWLVIFKALEKERETLHRFDTMCTLLVSTWYLPLLVELWNYGTVDLLRRALVGFSMLSLHMLQLDLIYFNMFYPAPLFCYLLQPARTCFNPLTKLLQICSYMLFSNPLQLSNILLASCWLVLQNTENESALIL